MRHAFDNQPHSALENVNDLLLRMRVRRHLTPGGKCGEHLIHRVAVRDRAAGDAWANFNCWSVWFHFRILRQALISRSIFSSETRDAQALQFRAGVNQETRKSGKNNLRKSA